jgi:type II secretory pathway pseudopilin PulG
MNSPVGFPALVVERLSKEARPVHDVCLIHPVQHEQLGNSMEQFPDESHSGTIPVRGQNLGPRNPGVYLSVMQITHRSTSRPKSRGFTILEAVVTVAVIALIAAIAVPAALDSQNQAIQARLHATQTILSQACVRASLDGTSVPVASQDNIQDVVAWYQSNGYLQNTNIDLRGITLAMLGPGSYLDCTGITTSGTSSLLPGAPGPVTETWWDTKYVTVALPSIPGGSQYLLLQRSSDGTTWDTVASSVTTFTDGPFEPSSSYLYRAVAVTQNGNIPGPTATVSTAPPLSAPNGLGVVVSTTSATPTPSPTPAPVPIPPVTTGLPKVPTLATSDPAAGNDYLTGSDWSSSPSNPVFIGTLNSSSSLAPPGAITITNLTSTGYTLVMPSLPHDLVNENGTEYDFAWGWMLFSSTDGLNWTSSNALEWRSLLGPPGVNNEFGWIDQATGAWMSNPGPISFTVSPSSTQYYQLVGQDSENDDVYGQVISVTTPSNDVSTGDGVLSPLPPPLPGAPDSPNQPTISNVGTTSLTLIMPSLPTRATGLTLEASVNGSAWIIVQSGLGAYATLNQTGLTPGATYEFCLFATNADGATQGTPISATTQSLTLPAAPGDVTIGDVTSNSFTLTLPSTLPSGATSFTLQTSINDASWILDGSNSNLPAGSVIAESGKTPNTSYPYLLLANNQNGSTAGSPFVVVTSAAPTPTPTPTPALTPTPISLPAAPDNPSVNNIGFTSFTITLPLLPSGATSLSLQTSTNGGASWSIDSTNSSLPGGTVIQETGKTTNTQYVYRVVAANASGTTFGSVFTVTTVGAPAAPDYVTASNITPSSMELTMPWLPAGATSLTLQTSPDNEQSWVLDGTNSSLPAYATVSETGLSANSEYYFRVLANNAYGSTPGPAYSISTAGSPGVPGYPIVGTITASSFSLSLPALPAEATSLSLFISTDENTWPSTPTMQALGANATANISGLNMATTYYCKLLAVNQWGTTAGLPVSVTTDGPPLAPDAASVTNVGLSGFTLSLPALPAGATSLALEASTNGGVSWAIDGTNSGLSGGATIQETGLAENTTYFYRLLASNSYGQTPGNSFNVTTAGLPDIPDSVIVGNVTLSSFAMVLPILPPGATSLTLQTSTDGGNTWETDSGNSDLLGGAAVQETGKQPGTPYLYRLIANNAYGFTPAASFTVTTASLPGIPGNATVSNLTTTSFSLTMPALPSGATSFTLETSSDGGNTWSSTPNLEGLGAQAVINQAGLSQNTANSYLLLAVNQWGSTPGSPFTVTTAALPGTPGSATVSNETASSFVLTLPALPANATSLTLQTSTDGGSTWVADMDGVNSDLAGGAIITETGKQSATTYLYRLVAMNAYGSTPGATFTATTDALPGTPGDATISGIGLSSFNITLPALPANATSYTLQSSTNGGSWSTDGTNSNLAGGGQISETGKAAATTYWYRLLAVNSYGTTPGTPFTVETASLPSTPEMATLSSLGATSFVLTLPVLPQNATSLTLQTSTDGGNTWVVDGTNANLTGSAVVTESLKTAGTTYYYQILAVNQFGSTAGTSFSVTTEALPDAPGTVTVQNLGLTSFTLALPVLPANATSLTLQASTDGGGTWTVINSGLSGGAVVQQTAENSGTMYYYKLLAVNQFGSTAGSTFTVTTPSLPGTPGNATVSNVGLTYFTLTMPSLPVNATSLTLETSTDGGSTWTTDGGNSNLSGSSTVNETGKQSATTYLYRLVAIDAYGSTPGASFTATTAALPGTPENATVSDIALSSFSITLPALSTNATSFTLQSSTNGGSTWSTDGTNTGLAGGSQISETGKAASTTYWYRLLAVNSYGTTAGGSFTVVTGSLPTTPGMATLSSLGATSFVLTLPALPSNATSLTLQTSTDGGNTWVVDGANSDLSGSAVVNETGKTPVTTYYYEVVAVNQYGSTASTAFTVTTGTLPSAPAAVAVSNLTLNSFSLTLPALPTNATSFTLENSTDGGNTWVVDGANSDLAGSAVVNETGKTPGTTYEYQLLAVNQFGSTAGSTFTVSTPSSPGTPATVAISNLGATSFTLTLPTLPANATSLTLQASTDGGATWTVVNSGLAGGALVQESSKSPSTTYDYQLEAVNPYAQTPGTPFSVTTAALPGTPGNATVSNLGASSFVLTLPSLPSNATSYTLQSSTDGGSTWSTDGTNSSLAGGSQISETGKAAATTYWYRLQAVNSFGTTAGGSFTVVTASLPATPGMATLSSLGATSFVLTLPALPANATSLTLQTSTDGGNTWVVDGANANLSGSAVVNETGKTPVTTYYYQILAVNQYGSTAGTAFSVTTGALPSAPAAVGVSNLALTSFSLTLPALPTNATSFTLQTSPDGGTTWVIDGTNTNLAGLTVVNETGKSSGTTYYYQLLAVNQFGSTAGSTFTVTTPSLPGTPGNATVSNIGITSFTLTMPSLPTNTTSLTLLTTTNGGATWTTLNSGLGGNATVNESGLTTNTTYEYALVAVNQYGQTSGSAFYATTTGLPGTPGAESVSNVTSTSFSITLPALPLDATSLTLQTWNGSAWVTDGSNSGLAGGATVNETGKTAGTTYTYCINAVNSFGSTQGSPFTVTPGNPPTIPDDITVSNLASTSFTLTMPALPSNATSLTLQTWNGSAWVTDGSHSGLAGGATVSETGKTSGTLYYYCVNAINSFGSTQGGTILVTPGTAPAIPAIPTLTNLGATSYTLIMPSLPVGAASLTLEVWNGSAWVVDGTNSGLAGGATVSETGKTAGSTYYYMVEAVNSFGSTSSGTSLGSSLQVNTPPGAYPGTPGTPAVSNLGSTSYTLTLPSLPANASSLTLEYSTNGASWTVIGSGYAGGATVNVTGKTAGSSNCYYVMAVGTYGNTNGNSIIVRPGNAPATPGIPALTTIGNTSFTLTMPSLPVGATSLTLEVWNGSAWVVDGTNSGLAGGATVSETGKTAGSTYYYMVEAVNSFGSTSSGTSLGSALQVIPGALPGTPGAVTVFSVYDTYYVWGTPALPANASYFQMYVSTNGGITWTNTGGTYAGNTAYTNIGLSPNTTYQHMLVAVNSLGSTDGAPFIFTTTGPPAVPGSISVTNLAATSYTLTLPSLPANATSLTLEYSTNGSSWTVIGSSLAGGQQLSVTGKTTHTSYYYEVVAVNSNDSTSTSGSPLKVTTP